MKDEAWAKFVHEDLGPGMAKRLAKERSYNENASQLFLPIRLNVRLIGHIFLPIWFPSDIFDFYSYLRNFS